MVLKPSEKAWVQIELLMVSSIGVLKYNLYILTLYLYYYVYFSVILLLSCLIALSS